MCWAIANVSRYSQKLFASVEYSSSRPSLLDIRVGAQASVFSIGSASRGKSRKAYVFKACTLLASSSNAPDRYLQIPAGIGNLDEIELSRSLPSKTVKLKANPVGRLTCVRFMKAA